jgi:hypothetical protein
MSLLRHSILRQSLLRHSILRHSILRQSLLRQSLLRLQIFYQKISNDLQFAQYCLCSDDTEPRLQVITLLNNLNNLKQNLNSLASVYHQLQQGPGWLNEFTCTFDMIYCA